jgi:hypothetical protein
MRYFHVASTPLSEGEAEHASSASKARSTGVIAGIVKNSFRLSGMQFPPASRPRTLDRFSRRSRQNVVQRLREHVFPVGTPPAQP